MDKSSVSASHNEIPSCGLTVLVSPEEPVLDIVFIHGFTGHPERTWAHKKGKETDHGEVDGDGTARRRWKVPRPDLFAKSPHHVSKSVYWPRDLLPHTIPNARVLTYGYDTRIRHWLGPPPSTNTVYGIAWDFLVALEGDGERRSNASRPVLFVAHSLGGIVVKEMLRRSSGCQMSQAHLHRIFESTVGVIFFGTPHGGSDPRGLLQHVAETAILMAGFHVNYQVVDSLLPAADRLKELRNEFNPIAHQRGWIIHSFQEQFGVKLFGGRKVVDDISSCLNYPLLETTEHITGNHMDMCRFPGLDNPEYKKVAAAVSRISETIRKQSKTGDCSPLSEDQRRMLLESLKFDQIDARHMTIKKEHVKTCKWLLSDPRYRDWFNVRQVAEHHGFFWIKGNPGTGKSTLIKYALAHAKRTTKDRIIVEFFFNARGEGLEKSTEGMYRSLLLQLLDRAPELQSAFDSIELIKWKINSQHEWSVEALKELFEDAVKNLGKHRLTCFIDALDECDEEQIRDMVTFFEHLGEMAIAGSIHFDVCFSSRHYPHITINKEISLILEGQKGHSLDIANYLDSELKIGHGELAREIRDELLNKASGIFLWVVLVVQILNKESDRGYVHRLRQKLRDIPAGLHELFRDILTRGHDNKDELLLSIQWVLFAKRPLTPEELYFAILSGVEMELSKQGRSEEITAEVMRRFILNCSKGLVEVTKSKKQVTVQFIHESVRDFLLKENGLGKLWSDIGSDFKAQSHERLKMCCAAYFDTEITHVTTPGDFLQKASSQETADLRQSAGDKYPLLEYAVENVLYHAEVAENGGISQDNFIDWFPRLHWIKLHNLFEKHKARWYTQGASLWYIFAEYNVPSLLRIMAKLDPFQDLIFGSTEERYGPPILAALATGSQDAVLAILRLEVDRHPPGNAFHDTYTRYCQNRNRRIKYSRDFKFRKVRKHETVLSYAMQNEDIALLTCLHEMGKASVNLDIADRDDLPLLCWAAMKGYDTFAQILLQKGADPNPRNNLGATPLSLAAENGHMAVVELLLSIEKVDIDSRDSFRGQTPVSWAAMKGHRSVVELLLSTEKVDIDSRDRHGRTPLSWAAMTGHKSVVELLLSTEKVDINSIDNFGETPLSETARSGHKSVVKLLLSTEKVDINSRDSYGKTPLSEAARNGHKSVVELLIATKGVNPDSRDEIGRTPLLWATGSRTNGKEIIELLLSTKGVNPDSRDKYGRTPLSLAAWEGNVAAVELLLSTKGVNPDSRDRNGRTPLSWAIERAKDKYRVVELLLSTEKVDPDLIDEEGETPLSRAVKLGGKDIIRLLESRSRFKRRIRLDGSVDLVSREGHENV